MNTEPVHRTRRAAGFWAGLFLASAGAVAGLKLSGAVEGGAAYLLFLIPTAMLYPLARATQRDRTASGCSSSAMMRYNRGMLIAALAYMLGLGVAIALWRNYELSQGVTFVLAMLPIAPIFGMIWVMARYLREESDEYLRHRAIMANMGGLAAVLAVGSFWGFLETFELVPHVPGWWSVPIWALGVGITQLVWKARGA